MEPSAIPPEALLQHATFLRSLAMHLLRDPPAAEDAVQETWRASIERPPSRTGEIRPWLATVLRNEARMHRRRKKRRARRWLLAARPEAVTSTAEHAARAEIIRCVSTAVCALEEPYRSTVVLRHYEGLAPRATALRTNTPVETVKSRLQRAHAKLRAKLDQGGLAHDWRLALCPIVGLDPRLLTSSAGGHATALGVAVMASKTKWVLTAALLLLCGFAAWQLIDGPEGVPDVTAEDVSQFDQDLGSEDTPRSPTLVAAGTEPSGRSRARAPDGAGKKTSAARGGALDALRARASAGVPGILRPLDGVVRVAGKPLEGGRVRIVRNGPPVKATAEGPSEGRVPVGTDGTFHILRRSSHPRRRCSRYQC